MTFENIRRAADPLYLSIFLDCAQIAGLATVDRPADRLSRRLCHREGARRTADGAAVPRHAAVLDQLSDPHLCLDRAAQPAGLINNLLLRLGLIAEPLPLLYNEFAVVLGLVYNYLPFVILAVYSSLQRLDPSYAEASRDLGASGRHHLPAHHPAADGIGRGGGRASSCSCSPSAIS